MAILVKSSVSAPHNTYLNSWRQELRQSTLRASLSGTFLQPLTELVTPLKRHSLSLRSCPPTLSAPSERFGYWEDCGSNTAHKHARKHDTHPPRVKEKKTMFRLDSNDLGFICAGELSVTNLPPLGIIEKLLNWQFVETYGVFNYGSGWRKDVVNQCLGQQTPVV